MYTVDIIIELNDDWSSTNGK